MMLLFDAALIGYVLWPWIIPAGIIVVIAILGVLAAGSAPVMVASIKATDAVGDVSTTLDKLRYASERIAFEIRELTVGSVNVTGYPGTKSLTFTRTDYGAAGTPGTARSVTVDQTLPTPLPLPGSGNLCNGTVRLSYDLPTILPAYTPVLTDRMCSLDFYYYDMNGSTTTTMANVRYIQLVLVLQPTVTSASYEQRTRVALRNSLK